MHKLEKQAVQLISRFVTEKLGRLSPLWYERLYSLPSEATNEREFKMLILAIYYALLRDVRSVRYVENLFFNWRECGVPQWALRRLAAADPPIESELLKEFGYYGKTDRPFDVRDDEYYRFYRPSTLGDE
ncbi:MAG: DnaD domain protein [Firmicutes bacterium]|nr:DnaD domain protein [Bacillota bacterium]